MTDTSADFTSEALRAETAFSGLGATIRDTMGEAVRDIGRAGAELAKTAKIGDSLTRTLKRGVSDALKGIVVDGKSASDVLRRLAAELASRVLNTAIDGLAKQLGSVVGRGIGSVLGFRDGGVIEAGRVRAFARGGILNGPTTFPMQGGLGLAGEAGPEAIMPLRRGPDGRLGVAGGQGGTTVNVTIATQDAASFERSRGQVAASLARAVAFGQRNL